MMRSMTGFARAESQGPWGRLSWELRAVNHRYLDLGFRLPEEFRPMEGELRQAAAAAISRGKVEATLRLARDGVAAGRIEVDAARIEELREVVDQIGHDWMGMAPVDPLRLLAFPGVIREPVADDAALLESARALFHKLVAEFNASRASEGARLEQYLIERCDALQQLVDAVRQRYAEVRGQALERLRARAAELAVELDAGRLEQEMVIILQRQDVEEEMSRLLSHLIEVRSACVRDQAVGRRLDFLMQELNREANTLSSKSQDAEMTRLAVEMKVAIEQMREQVQNIE